jgi:LysM repeat protein
LEQVVQEQSKRIDSLTQQVAKLRLFLETKNEVAAASAGEEPPKPPAEAAPEAPKAEAVAKAEPKAEEGDGTKHVVAKGETLTSIAKHYNIPLAELQKANKNVNDRKLQIGQTLTIPTPKTPESAPEKKD